jgi:hypothetical protein
MHEQYINYFIDENRKVPWIIRKENKGWKYRKYKPISNMEVVDHLNQQYHVGIYRKTSSYFFLDLDNKSHPTKFILPLEERFTKVSSSFPVSPQIIQSSDSKGLHAYYFFDKSYLVDQIKPIIIRRLQRMGIILEDGQYELFPTFKGNGHRLPFGKDSFLLDSNFNPTHSNPIEGIDPFFRGIHSHTLNLDEIMKEDENWENCIEEENNFENGTYNNIISNNIDNNLINLSSLPSLPLHTDNVSSFLHLRAENLWEEGIQAFGTRNSITWHLICHCYWNGLDKDETYEKIEEWLYEKNNGLSNDWNKRKDWVLKDLRESITRRFAYGGGRKAYLTIGDLKRMVLLIGDDLKKFQFLYDLLLYVKGKVKNEHLSIPKVVFESFRGAGRNTYVKQVQFCKENKIIELVREYSTDKHRAREYRCLFEFSNDTPPIRSLEYGLYQVMQPEEIKGRYGRYYFKKILEAVHQQKEEEVIAGAA